MIQELSEVNVVDLIDKKFVIVGLDVGDKTIGVAVSDNRLKIASGITTFARRENDIQQLMNLLTKYNVGAFVVGWPIQMNGLPGEQCKKVQNFIEKLNAITPLPIIKWDERFSTKVVESVLIEANISRKRRKQYVDKIAAAYFLQGVLDYFSRRI